MATEILKVDHSAPGEPNWIQWTARIELSDGTHYDAGPIRLRAKPLASEYHHKAAGAVLAKAVHGDPTKWKEALQLDIARVKAEAEAARAVQAPMDLTQ